MKAFGLVIGYLAITAVVVIGFHVWSTQRASCDLQHGILARTMTGFACVAATPPTSALTEFTPDIPPLLDDPAQYLLQINRPSGHILVLVHPDGSVELYGNPNEAARIFWSAMAGEMSRRQEARSEEFQPYCTTIMAPHVHIPCASQR